MEDAFNNQKLWVISEFISVSLVLLMLIIILMGPYEYIS